MCKLEKHASPNTNLPDVNCGILATSHENVKFSYKFAQMWTNTWIYIYRSSRPGPQLVGFGLLSALIMQESVHVNGHNQCREIDKPLLCKLGAAYYH